MRSLYRIGLVALYLGVTVGISVATHICAGEPVSTRLLGHPPSEPAECCGDDEPLCGCCSTVVTTLHLDDDHLLTTEWSPDFAALGLAPLPAALLPPDQALTLRQIEASSLHGSPPLHLLHSVLLI
jgi:hypothetical protein